MHRLVCAFRSFSSHWYCGLPGLQPPTTPHWLSSEIMCQAPMSQLYQDVQSLVQPGESGWPRSPKYVKYPSPPVGWMLLPMYPYSWLPGAGCAIGSSGPTSGRTTP